MAIVYLSLGSNLKNPRAQISNALTLLKEAVSIVKISSFWISEPIDAPQQCDFINIMAKIKTKLDPYKLLDFCQKIENDLGRVRKIPKGPRTIDIDIIYYDNLKICSERLIIPHKLAPTRAFVMLPLMEIRPTYRNPLGDLIDHELFQNQVISRIKRD